MTRSGSGRVRDSEITVIGLDDRAAWEAATADLGLPSQTWSYAWGLASEGIVPRLAVVRTPGAQLLLPFHERSFRGRTDIATLPGLSGALLTPDDPAPFAAWADHARDEGWVSGYVQLAFANGGFTAEPPDAVAAHNVHFVFDMNRWDLSTSVGPGTRRSLRAGDRCGAVLVTDRDRLAKVFPDLYRMSMARAGSAGFGAEALHRWFGDPNSIAFGAELDGRVEAAHLGHARNGLAELHLAGSTDKGRALQAWLIRRAAEALGDHGIRFVDIGGYGRAGDGLHVMKRRLGLDELPMTSLRQVYDQPAYDALCAQTGADSAAPYFPPYRAAGLGASESAVRE